MQTIPPRHRIPNNHPVRGFHEPTDILLGFPTGLPQPHNQDADLIDPRRNADWIKHDLALRYCYEIEEDIKVNGEWMTFPVVHYVYRRDRDLRWSEIRAYLKNGDVPFRYPPRGPLNGFGWVNDPMNEENFIRIARRFKLVDRGYLSEICERSTGRQVQKRYLRFEEEFVNGPGTLCRPWYLGWAHPGAIHALVLIMGPKLWYLNALQRARRASKFIRDTLKAGRSLSIEEFAAYTR
ncbi:hypothetical protein B0H12DRAFT_1075416 [Mycena haematopus]|nr:hypothetical protein B0H12DRAFT_1075416 [Mycena haematopus]